MNLAAGVRLLRNHLRPHRRALWRLVAWSAVEAVPAFLAGLLVAAAVDRGFLAGRPLVGFAWLGALAVLWAVGAAGTRQVYPALAAAMEPLRDSLVTEVVTASVRRGLRGVEATGAQTTGGASVSQATVHVESVKALLSSLLRSMRQMLSAGVAALGGLTVLSPLLAGVVGGFVLLALVVFVAMLRLLLRRQRTVVLRQERVTAVAAPVLQGMRDVVAAAAEERAAREVGAAIDAEAAATRALARARAMRLPVLALGAHLPLLTVLALAPWLLGEERLTVGQLVGAVMYLSTGLTPAVQLLVSAGGTVLANLGVILGRLAEVAAEAGPAPPAAPGRRPARRDIALRRVTFAYSPHAEPVVRDLTLDIPEGLHLAVVGPSGVGKSTLANLLARLAVPQRGQVRLGDAVLDRVDEPYLRQTVALIPQEAYVFAGTVRDNLRYLAPRATDEELQHAVRAVGLEDVVARLGGLDGETAPGGGTLSPGERQLIALARVHLSPARVVILDEATCHLDPVAEARAEQAFADRGGTLVVIAHRVSSALRAEQILVMDGEQTAFGSHEELLDRSPLYATLVGCWGDGMRPAVPAAAAGPRDRVLGGLDLVACGVEFGYGPHVGPVLEDLHLTVRHGEHLAVVGPAGAGKSTLAAVLAGLLTPRRGSVTLGGVPLAGMHPRSLRTLVALVPELGYMVVGTVRDNLTCLAPDVDDERITAAATALGATELLADGLDAPAAGLPPRRRQLVALVRAYLGGAEVVVLDEATCHLEPAAEVQVERAFRRRGRSLVTVTRRLSAASRADRVVVLDDARGGRVTTPGGLTRRWGLWNAGPERPEDVPALVRAGDDALARLRPWRRPCPTRAAG
jgi:ABC-type multidrug transport system fused ATPase/permease subunit